MTTTLPANLQDAAKAIVAAIKLANGIESAAPELQAIKDSALAFADTVKAGFPKKADGTDWTTADYDEMAAGNHAHAAEILGRHGVAIPGTETQP